MNGLIMAAMLAVSMPQVQTDTTFAVEGAEKLSVETEGGSIEVGVWDEDRIRVQAEHSLRTFVRVRRRRSGIQLESEARRGPANLVDFHVTVPRRMALELSAQYGDITIEGSDGTVEAETLQGDVRILGGRGSIKVEATIGQIMVEGANGRIEIESSAADISVTRSSGEIYAETAGGSIVLQDVTPTAVDVGSTGGRVYYDGSFEPEGTYFFGAHGGSITIVVPDGAAASFDVATVHGSITSNLNGEAESLKSGERHEFEIGGGGAIVEAETYGGRIRLVRSGTEGSEPPTPNRRRIRDDGLADAGATVVAPVWAPVIAPGLADELATTISAEVGPRVAAEVTPRVAVEVATEVTPRVAVEVATEVTPRVAVRVREEVRSRFQWRSNPVRSPESATIRR